MTQAQRGRKENQAVATMIPATEVPRALQETQDFQGQRETLSEGLRVHRALPGPQESVMMVALVHQAPLDHPDPQEHPLSLELIDPTLVFLDLLVLLAHLDTLDSHLLSQFRGHMMWLVLQEDTQRAPSSLTWRRTVSTSGSEKVFAKFSLEIICHSILVWTMR